MSAVDMSGLDAFDGMSFGALIEGKGLPEKAPSADGKPLELPLADIEEDPDQPRQEFSQESLDEIAESIRQRGVRTPVSVKQHPTKPGKWILNHGARRYRGSILADKTTIPAFVDHTHDSYDQVIENIQRENLTPMEIATFIQRREAAGEKKGQIAKRLGKSASFVSKHAALLDMAPSVRDAYNAGRCRDVEALYLLVKNYEAHAKAIDALCVGAEGISKYVVADLLAAEKNPQPASNTAGTIPVSTLPTSVAPLGAGAGLDNPPSGDGNASGADTTTSQSGNANSAPAMTGDDVKAPSGGGREVDPNKIRKPIVQVRYDERPARLLLDRRAAAGLAWIKYDDDGQEVEVDIGQASLVAIVEGA